MSVMDKKQLKSTKKSNYLSGKEIRAIAKQNAKVMRELENYKHRKAPESEFTTELKTSWEIDGETVETVSDFIFGGSKITADGDCSHEIKRRLLLGKKVMYDTIVYKK